MVQRLTDLYSDYIDIQYQLGDAQDRATQAQNDYNAAVAAHDYKAAQEATKALTDAQEDVESLTNALVQNEGAQTNVTRAINEYGDAAGAASGPVQGIVGLHRREC